ncbi:MBL fold metallo-hydrolase [Nocardia sp. NPDC057455]|uniref:MBL fold metallo-hydrolase n=1 Tax=Nocardia sp. NPDC057455 TaxID=3346138 RepID=UPI003671B46D
MGLPSTGPLTARTGAAGTWWSCCTAGMSMPWRTAFPRRPDAELLASITDAGLPPARATVRLTALVHGVRPAPAYGVIEGVLRPRTVAIAMTSFLVEHPRARFLVDPAMCTDVHTRVLPRLRRPYRELVAPSKALVGLADSLAMSAIPVERVDFAIATHLHWDHVAGLLDLPESLALRATTAELKWATNPAATPIGVAESLGTRPTPSFDLDGPPVLTFSRSHDLFGDGSVLAVDLSGHTPGSIGLVLAVPDGGTVLLAGDAVWRREQIALLRAKPPLPGLLVDHDRSAAFAAIHRLHRLPAGIEVIPAHDHAAAKRWAP